MFGEMPTKRTRIQVLKPRIGHVSRYIVAGSDVFSFYVHWLSGGANGRSYLCPGEDCPACLSGIGAKYLGLLYVGLLGTDGTRPRYGVLELTEAAYFRLRDCAISDGGAIKAGFCFEASRRSQKSPLSFRPVLETDADRACTLPNLSVGFLADGVATLYGLPSYDPDETIEMWSDRSRDSALRLISLAMRRLPLYDRP